MPWRHAAQRRDPALRCARAQRDGALTIDIERVWQTSRQVYGVDKVWQQLNREGIVVARCTVERLMRRLGLRGVVRGKVARTTVANATTPYPIAYKLYHFFIGFIKNKMLLFKAITDFQKRLVLERSCMPKLKQNSKSGSCFICMEGGYC